jgi:hypothetical protein
MDRKIKLSLNMIDIIDDIKDAPVPIKIAAITTVCVLLILRYIPPNTNRAINKTINTIGVAATTISPLSIVSS